MTTKSDLQELTEFDVSDLSSTQLFKLKREHDKYIEDALKRCTSIHKPVEVE